MKTSKIIIVLLQALIKILIESMNSMETSGNVDSDGVPLDDDYQKCGFFLASIRDTLKTYADETKE